MTPRLCCLFPRGISEVSLGRWGMQLEAISCMLTMAHLRGHLVARPVCSVFRGARKKTIVPTTAVQNHRIRFTLC